MKGLLLAFVASVALSGAASAQIFGARPLSPRPLPPGVSIPAVTSSSVSYPGCPGEVTSHTNTWTFDEVNGFAQNDYTNGTNGAPVVTAVGPPSGQGTATHPWNNLQALTGNNAGTPSSSYAQILLSSAPGGNGSSPIVPGDLVLVNTGSYGAVTFGASTQIINSPALTIQAGVGQAPLLTTLTTSEVVGLHVEGAQGTLNFKVQSVNPGSGVGLVTITDNHVPLSTSDIILENMDISSAPVATANTWSQATWLANTRPGVTFESFFDNTPSTTMSCVSLVNSHVYEASLVGIAAVEGEAATLLVQGNEIDHILAPAINFDESNTAIGHNHIHDFVDNGIGNYEHYAIENTQTGILTPSLHQSNIYIYNNKMIESVDPGQTFQALISFYLNSCGDITNFVAWDNLAASGGASGISPGNAHNFVVANNSIMFSGTGQNPEINLAQAHCGSTGPYGTPPSNGWVFNNIAPIFNNANGAGVQTYHNISAPGSTGFNTWNYPNVWQQVFVGPTPGSVITLSSVSGQQNLIDGGVGGGSPQSNEFTAVPAASSFPMSPQPNWTPLPGSPAKTAGSVQLIPALPDFNGVTPNNSIGALN